MKLYTDKVTAQTSNREHNLRAKKVVKELNREEGKYFLIGNKGIRFTFKTKEQRENFRNEFKHYFE